MVRACLGGGTPTRTSGSSSVVYDDRWGSPPAIYSDPETPGLLLSPAQSLPTVIVIIGGSPPYSLTLYLERSRKQTTKVLT
jgi:hypothetical protein